MQAPDRGLLPAVVIAIAVVSIGRLVATWAFRSERFQSLPEDEYTTLVCDGVILMNKLKKTRMTIERLFAQLRSEGIRQLGEVKRLYFEANGSFTIIKNRYAQTGIGNYSRI